MTAGGKLRAWIERSHGETVIAAFIGATTLSGGKTTVADRKPAMRACASVEKARQWVESEATALGLPVEWVDVTAWVSH